MLLVTKQYAEIRADENGGRHFLQIWTVWRGQKVLATFPLLGDSGPFQDLGVRGENLRFHLMIDLRACSTAGSMKFHNDSHSTGITKLFK